MPNNLSLEQVIAELTKLASEFQTAQSHHDVAPLGAPTEAWQSSTEFCTLNSLHERLNIICAFYLDTDKSTRQRIRDAAAAQRSLLYALHNHPGWCSQQLISAPNSDCLRTGLAAVAMHDNRIDFRDTYVALGHLYLTAIAAGIQPSLDLNKVGALASDESRTNHPEDSTQNFLQHFEDSAYFVSSVQPKLNAK